MYTWHKDACVCVTLLDINNSRLKWGKTLLEKTIGIKRTDQPQFLPASQNQAGVGILFSGGISSATELCGVGPMVGPTDSVTREVPWENLSLVSQFWISGWKRRGFSAP